MTHEQEIAKLRAAYGDRLITPDLVHVGDHALSRKKGREDISGEVVRLTTRSATIKQRYRNGPGPWFEQEFVVDRADLLYIVRP